jgi:hypothetical protein
MRITIVGAVALLMLGFAVLAKAEPPGGDSAVVAVPLTTVQEASPKPVETLPPVLPGDAVLTAGHDYLSQNVEELSRKMDAFFGTEQAFAESSGTYIQARGSVIYLEDGEVDFDGNVRAKLDLPSLKRKLSLVIESESDDSPEQKGRLISGSPTVAETFDNKTAAASLQFVLREERGWDIRLQPGIKLHWPPETFLRLRFRLMQPISETWLSRTTLTPGWFDSRGWEVRLRHDFDRDTGRGSLFRVASEAIWLVKEDRNVELVQSIAYTHPLGRRAHMGYEAGVAFETDPTFWETGYYSSLRYRRDIHRGWLFLELKPQIGFARDNGFKADLSFVLSLEVVFGGRTLATRQN